MTPEWALVVLTGVYVLATIAICWANWNSARWTRKQTAAMIQQFEETNRARVVVRFDKPSWAEQSLVLKNIGKRIATNVRLTIDESFMNALNSWSSHNLLKTALQSKMLIAPEQEYWFLLGLNTSLDKLSTKTVHVGIKYQDGEITHQEETIMELNQYNFLAEAQTSMGDNKPV